MPHAPLSRHRLSAGDSLPAWFSCSLFVALVWCAVAGTTASVLLWFGWYHAATCSLLATVAAAAAWRFRPRAADEDRAAHGPALAAVAIALVLLTSAGVFHSQHLFTDRDPSVYIDTGRSIARTHHMLATIAPGPFDAHASFLSKTAGFTIAKHRLHPGFLAFLPALLALGWSAGGDTGLLLVPALLGALGLLAVYALGSKLLGPRWALLPPVILTLAPLQSWFARDAYAELPFQALALGGLWLFLETRPDGRSAQGVIAGVVLGAITFIRIDALAVLVAIPAALTLEHLRAATLEPAARTRRRGFIWSFGAATGAIGLVGLVASRELSPGYLHDLRRQYRQLELALVAGIIVAAAIAALARARPGLGRRFARNETVFRAGAGVIFALAVYAYVWRPRSVKPKIGPNPSDAALASLHDFYYSSSFRWFAWYLGACTLVLAVIGFVLLARRALRADGAASLLLAAAVPVATLYITRPSISPDHLWAMRRYLPVVLPAMTIAAVVAIVCATSFIAARQPRLRAPFIVLFIAAMVVPAAISGLPLARAQMQGGALTAVHTLCARTGPDGAVAVEPYGFLGDELTQTLRSFCGVPAAGLVENQKTPLTTFASEWKARGRRFYVATTSQKPVLDAAPGAVEVAHVVVADAHEPERTFSRPPRKYAPRPVEVWLYRVDPI